MQSHEVLKAAFKKSTPKAIASEIGVSLSLIYKWAQEQSDSGSGSKNPLDRIMEIFRLTQHIEIIEWICEQSGGYFVKEEIREEDNQPLDVFPAMNEILFQFSELLSKISEAAKDNSSMKFVSIGTS
jgi:transcriptional regulator with XRE-family HTH domain